MRAGGVAERVPEFLDEGKWKSDAALAAMIGERISARVPASLQKGDIKRLWQFEQYLLRLPVLAVEVTDGLLSLAYPATLRTLNPSPFEACGTLRVALAPVDRKLSSQPVHANLLTTQGPFVETNH